MSYYPKQNHISDSKAVEMRYRPNTINGAKPEFGNPEHIAFIKEKTAIFSGEVPFHQIEWERCTYKGHVGTTGRPVFDYAKHGDAVVDYIPCPNCNRLHILLISFDPQGNWYDELIQIDETAKEFKCWNCHTEFTTDDDRNVFVKPETR